MRGFVVLDMEVGCETRHHREIVWNVKDAVGDGYKRLSRDDQGFDF